KFAGARIKDLRADHISRQQVRRELDARERQLKALGQGADGECLRQPGHAFQKDMAAGEQAYQEPVEHGALTDDDPFELRLERPKPGPKVAHHAVYFLNVHGHGSSRWSAVNDRASVQRSSIVDFSHSVYSDEAPDDRDRPPLSAGFAM